VELIEHLLSLMRERKRGQGMPECGFREPLVDST
jgi:hypothetical protein